MEIAVAQDAEGRGAASADPLVGAVINGRYRIVEPLAQGAVGRIYRASQLPLERAVAIKVLAGARHDQDFYKRFATEAAVTAKLTHPNTVTLIDFGRTQDGTLFLAMEFLRGRTLQEAIADEPLQQVRAIHVAQQICRSLREAHALGIVHRDLKPANVMLLRQQDEQDFVKVLDFGLGQEFGSNKDGDAQFALFQGTPHYLSPEQARSQPLDGRSDIYALGVVLYQMLTGRVPFGGDVAMDVIARHLAEPPVPPRAVRPDLQLDEALERIVLRCLLKDREARYQSMDEVLAHLKAVRAMITRTRPQGTLPPAPWTDSTFGADPTPWGMTPLSLPAMAAPGAKAMASPEAAVRSSVAPPVETLPPAPARSAAGASSFGKDSFAGLARERPWTRYAAAFVVLLGGAILLVALSGGEPAQPTVTRPTPRSSSSAFTRGR